MYGSLLDPNEKEVENREIILLTIYVTYRHL